MIAIDWDTKVFFCIVAFIDINGLLPDFTLTSKWLQSVYNHNNLHKNLKLTLWPLATGLENIQTIKHDNIITNWRTGWPHYTHISGTKYSINRLQSHACHRKHGWSFDFKIMRLHYITKLLHPQHIEPSGHSEIYVGHSISSKVKMAIYSGNKQIYSFRKCFWSPHMMACRQTHTHIVTFYFHTIHFSVSKHPFELLLVISTTICHPKWKTNGKNWVKQFSDNWRNTNTHESEQIANNKDFSSPWSKGMRRMNL